jgi:hypothetical protein
LEANQQFIERQTKDNFKNEKESARLTKTPFQTLMLDIQVLRTEERLVGHKLFLTTISGMTRHMDWGVFKKSTVPNDDLHTQRCSRLFIQMNGCNIFLNYNLWFRVVKIKTKQGFL